MAEKLTKKEAVRQALATLGNNAMPVEIKDWVKKQFDIEMTAGHVSTTKGEILRKPVEKPAEAAAPASPEQPAANAAPGTPPPSKAEAVRQALKALGKKASRTEIHTFVKEKLGIEMSLDHVSTAKAEALKKMKKVAKAGKKAAVATIVVVEPIPAPKAEPAGNGTGGILVTDLVKLKELVKKLGADPLRKLIAAMSGS